MSSRSYKATLLPPHVPYSTARTRFFQKAKYTTLQLCASTHHPASSCSGQVNRPSTPRSCLTLLESTSSPRNDTKGKVVYVHTNLLIELLLHRYRIPGTKQHDHPPWRTFPRGVPHGIGKLVVGRKRYGLVERWDWRSTAHGELEA